MTKFGLALQTADRNAADMHTYRQRMIGSVGPTGSPRFKPSLLTSLPDLQNTLFEMSMGGKLYLAPAKVVHHCLDVGTGTGINLTRGAFAHVFIPRLPSLDLL